MLGKLLKYEFKSTARTLIPLYIIAIIFSAICRGFNELSKNLDILQTPSVLLYILYVILIIAVVVITLVMVLQRFYKNLMGDEGYLMFTLPVEPYKHILTKLTTGLIWTASSIIVALSTLFILIYTPDLWDEIIFGLESVPVEVWEQVRFAVFIIIFSSVSSIMMIYAAISIGQLVTGHKVVGSLVAYFGLYIINQIIMTAVLAILGYVHQDLFYGFIDGTSFINSDLIVQLSIILSLIYAGLSTAYFFTINFILKNKLNLE